MSMLNDLLKEAHEKLEEAQIARGMVTMYLDRHYGITDDEIASENWLEDECEWCYGIDTDAVKRLIDGRSEDV